MSAGTGDRDEFGRGYYKQPDLYANPKMTDDGEGEYEDKARSPRNPCSKVKANLIGSALEESDHHMPCIDIDHPCRLIESSPGKFHLYIDKKVSGNNYTRLLDALQACGLIEAGFNKAYAIQGQTFLRVPWLKKKSPEEL